METLIAIVFCLWLLFCTFSERVRDASLFVIGCLVAALIVVILGYTIISLSIDGIRSAF